MDILKNTYILYKGFVYSLSFLKSSMLALMFYVRFQTTSLLLDVSEPFLKFLFNKLFTIILFSEKYSGKTSGLGHNHWFLFVVVTSFIITLIWVFYYLLQIREFIKVSGRIFFLASLLILRLFSSMQNPFKQTTLFTQIYS